MTRALVLVGGGEHARVVAEAARLAGWQVLGCVARDATDQLPYLGSDGDLSAVLARTGALAILALGTIRTRQRLAGLHPQVAWATVVHPAAVISAQATLGAGVYVGALAIINPGAVIADHAVVNSGCIVEHDCRVGVHAHLAPGCVLGGRARIGDAVLVGLGARVRDGIAIGDGAIVGMGAVVVGTIPAGVTVVGVPAKEHG